MKLKNKNQIKEKGRKSFFFWDKMMDSQSNLKLFTESKAICTKCLKPILIDPTLLEASFLAQDNRAMRGSGSDLGNIINERNEGSSLTDLNFSDSISGDTPTLPSKTTSSFSLSRTKSSNILNSPHKMTNIPQEKSHRVKAKFYSALFAGATQYTAESNIDHPLCSDCTKKEIYRLNDSIQNLAFQEASYMSYLEQLKEKDLKENEEPDLNYEQLLLEVGVQPILFLIVFNFYTQKTEQAEEEERRLEEEIEIERAERKWIKQKMAEYSDEYKKIDVLYQR